MSICLTGDWSHHTRAIQDKIDIVFEEEMAESEEIQLQIREMHDRAICTLERIQRIYDNKIIQPDTVERQVIAWNSHPDFKKWFGRLPSEEGEAMMIEFEERLEEMIRRLSTDEITYKVRNGRLSFCQLSPTNAFVRRGPNARTIFLCPKWFEQNETQKVATLIHEVVHTFGFSHPMDTDTPLKAFRLAKKHPQLAIQSPENYESLAKLYVCDKPKKLDP